MSAPYHESRRMRQLPVDVTGLPAETGVERPSRSHGGGAAAARDERDALLLPRAAGSTTGLVELRARAGRVRDTAVDERAAPDPGTRGLRDQACGGTRREGTS